MGLSRGCPRRGGPIRGSESGKVDPRGTDPTGPEQRGAEPSGGDQWERVKSRGSNPTMVIRGFLSRPEPRRPRRGNPSRERPNRRGHSKGADPRMSIQGYLSRHAHTNRQMKRQTNKRRESERKIRAVEMLKARTAGQRQARQTMECENDQANGQVIAQPPPHWMRAEIADDQLEMSQSGMSGRRRKMKKKGTIDQSINRSINHQPINRSMHE